MSPRESWRVVGGGIDGKGMDKVDQVGEGTKGVIWGNSRREGNVERGDVIRVCSFLTVWVIGVVTDEF